ncbi:adenosylcobinamide-GDP ribazoletransferase [Yoonia sp.]|uniref:adenosylcobinamide-GDP ribazoletransferase n=1 Tax=Yoonia sp. TaxID=2212373 RepID=UPI002FDB0589
MPDKDDTRLIAPVDLYAALGLLTRVPVRVDAGAAVSRGAGSAWAYPLVGAMLGFVGAVLVSVLVSLGLTAGVVAGLLLAFGIIVTGAMHEDGLADSADGLWGGWERSRRLEIMKDSHIGVYGVCAVGLSLVLRWATLVVVVEMGAYWAVLIAVGALSRAAMVVVMASLPNARGDGLSRSVGRPAARTMWLGVAIAVAFALVSGLPESIAIAAFATLACALIAKAKIGGQTGDILGATQQVTEIVLLAAVVASIT